MDLKVSIIVPIYNVESYIVRCLDSIARQTYPNIEVVFVDDCGIDKSMSILQNYLSTHSFPVYKIIKHTYNRGLSAARNTGLEKASGKYVYFLDSDDEIYDTCIESLINPLEDFPYEVVVGSYQVLFENGTPEYHVLPMGKLGNPLKAYADGIWYVMAWNKLCKKSFLIENSLYFKEGLLHEDVLWSFQLACKCSSMYLVNDLTYNYILRRNSIITSMNSEQDMLVYVKAFDAVRNFVLEEKLFDNQYIYSIIEGKKSGLLYSLLRYGQYSLYRKIYSCFYHQKTVSPWKAYKKGIIGFSYFLRDFHYCLPMSLGVWWKWIFYWIVYKLCHKKLR